MLPTPLNSVPQDPPPPHPHGGGEGVQRHRTGLQRASTSNFFKPYHLKTLNVASTAKLVKMCVVPGTVNLTNSTAAGSHTKHRRQQVTQSAIFTAQIIQIRQAARSSAEGDAEGELCEVFSKSKNQRGDRPLLWVSSSYCTLGDIVREDLLPFLARSKISKYPRSRLTQNKKLWQHRNILRNA
jgi:hypothetical protein